MKDNSQPSESNPHRAFGYAQGYDESTGRGQT